ncbi:hypothetical protein HPB49_007619 [Dermacentor silvarum]|uniref:Uncharacterized protein n=1 Tax=Dermacentor silvarum TaxID=543639 RepID=A0ACB8DBE7_DERSI|nr:hypothetical protein HPB49_007619 [Dermacentor silvarum]
MAASPPNQRPRGAYIGNLEPPTAVLALQEIGAAVKLSGFNAFQRDPSICLLVNQGYTAPEQGRATWLYAGGLYLTDPVQPSLVGNFVTQDTCPDLTLTKHIRHADWINTEGTSQIKLTKRAPDVDNHLMHLWEARRSLTKRWRRQKQNRKLRARISDLTQQAAEYAAQLAHTHWVDSCNNAARQMSSRNTWRLFRSLIDPTRTR